mmetsp:Transcript_12453/g.34246  ORF Transcript_12453/g.34246 Transcript_12453/m.34246 type:complete len:85 (+) Transcript_12453:1350-1604(+)
MSQAPDAPGVDSVFFSRKAAQVPRVRALEPADNPRTNNGVTDHGADETDSRLGGRIGNGATGAPAVSYVFLREGWGELDRVTAS